MTYWYKADIKSKHVDISKELPLKTILSIKHNYYKKMLISFISTFFEIVLTIANRNDVLIRDTNRIRALFISPSISSRT